jgi:hypothetical protein
MVTRLVYLFLKQRLKYVQEERNVQPIFAHCRHETSLYAAGEKAMRETITVPCAEDIDPWV